MMMEEIKSTIIGVNLTLEAFHRPRQGNFNASDEKVLEFMLEKCNKIFVPFSPHESNYLLLCACASYRRMLLLLKGPVLLCLFEELCVYMST
jgi:hypothetical protein